MSKNKIPTRNEVPAGDKWDLSSIYKSDSDWEEALKEVSSLTDKAASFKGKLGDSSQTLLEAFKAFEAVNLKLETVYHYASLLHSADENDSSATDKNGRAMMAYTKMSSELSFFEPELQEIPEDTLKKWIALPEFADYKIFVEKLLYLKQYILSEKEERILSLQSQSGETADTAFSVLTNVDMNETFGTVKTEGEEKPLTQTTWSVFLHSQDREVRKAAYKQFYKKFEENQHTIVVLYVGFVN